MTTIPAVPTDELLKICDEIGDENAPGQVQITNRTLKLNVKARPDMIADFFKAGISESIFPAAWTGQKLTLLPKAGKVQNVPFSYGAICLPDTILEQLIYRIKL